MHRSIVRFLLWVSILLSLCFGAYAEEAGFVGSWRCISFVYEGNTYFAVDVDFEAVFDLAENGVAEIRLDGETEIASWSIAGGAPVVTAANGAYAFAQNGDLLEMTDSGVRMSFGREPDAVNVNPPEAAGFVPSGSITAAQEFDYMGMWRLTSFAYNGVTYVGEEIGTDLAFLFSCYNNVQVIVNGESRNTHWAIQNGAILADTGQMLYRFMPDGEKLVVQEEGSLLTFERDLAGSVNVWPWGSAKRLEGKSLLVSIFVTLDGYGWSDGEIVSAMEKLAIASGYICDRGMEYGKDVEFVYDFEAHPDLRYDMRFEGNLFEYPEHDRQLTKDEKDALRKTHEAIMRFMEEHVPYRALADRYQTDSIAFVVHVNKHARSYAAPYSVGGVNSDAEIAVVFDDSPAVYAHEILHLFGAVDFYRADDEMYVSDEVVAYVKKHFPTDIMVTNYGKGGEITNELTRLTALGLGWIDDVPELERFPELKSNIPGAYTPHYDQLFNKNDEYEYSLEGGKATITGYLIRFERDPVLVIPDTLDGYPVTGIGMYAFGKFTELTSVIIPAGVASIENNPFSDCASLTCFEVSPDNPAYSQIDGVLFDKGQKTLIAYPGGRKGEYNIPQGVEHIGYYAFKSCSGLPGLAIPDSVTDIGHGAFYQNAGLISLTIPDSVTSIAGFAFNSCDQLTSVIIPASVKEIGNRAFDRCPRLTLSVAEGSYGEKYAQENGIRYVIDPGLLAE